MMMDSDLKTVPSLQQSLGPIVNTVEFSNCFYAPISFVLFLVALTFPLNPTAKKIAEYNLWLISLLEIAPLKISLTDAALKLGFDLYRNPLKLRSEFIDFVIKMHEHILHDNLNPCKMKTVLTLFACLRATECGPTAISQKQEVEASCTRKSQVVVPVCAVMTTQYRGPSLFLMDDALRPPDLLVKDAVTDAYTNENAFCSSVFAVKWFVLHMFAFAYRPEHKEKHHIFLRSFGEVLACFACRMNFTNNLTKVGFNIAVDLESRDAYRGFIHRLHNNVNAMLGKPQNVSLQETLEFFNTLQTQTSPDHHCSIVISSAKQAAQRFYFLP